MKIKGFTPLSDTLIQEFGLITASVYGKVWRYCDAYGICEASRTRIAEELGISEKTAYSHLKTLEENGYITIFSRPGFTSQIIVTDKITFGAVMEETSNPGNSYLPPRQELPTPPVRVTDEDTLIDTIQETLINDDDGENPYRFYEVNFGSLTKYIGESITDIIAEWEEHKKRLDEHNTSRKISGERAFYEAAKLAVKNEKRSMRYVNAILKNWMLHGFGWKPTQKKAGAETTEKAETQDQRERSITLAN